MNKRRELVLDTDKPTFIMMVVAIVIVCVSLAWDLHQWINGRWIEPLERPVGALDWFAFGMATLTMAWFVIAFRHAKLRLFRLACGLILVSMLMKAALFVLSPTSIFAVTVNYVRSAFAMAALISLLIWLALWVNGIVVHA